MLYCVQALTEDDTNSKPNTVQYLRPAGEADELYTQLNKSHVTKIPRDAIE